MKIQKVTDPAFRRYGKVLEGYNFGPLLKEMKHTPVPEDVVYVPSARGAGSSRYGKRAEKTERLVDYLSRSDIAMVTIKAECPGISSEFRDQCSSDRSCTAYRTSAGYRRGSYIRYLKGGGISGTGRNRDRGLCHNAPLCTVS